MKTENTIILKIKQFLNLSETFIISQITPSLKLGFQKNKTFHNQFGISFLRILATLSVIVIHVSGPLVVKYGQISNFDWNIANFFDSISRYSVPIFFMISGALLLKKDYNLKDFLKIRLGKILPAFLFWSLFYSLFNRYILGDEYFDINKIMKDIFYGSEYHLWFIYILIGIYLITPIIRKWIKYATQNEILYFIIIWVITLIIEIPGFKIYFPKIDFSYFSGFLGYFVLGYYLSQFKLIEKSTAVLLIVIGFCITIFGTYFFTLKNMKFYEYFYGYLTLNALMVSLGLFIFFNKCLVLNARINLFTSKISNSCYGIYLIHPLILYLLKFMDVDGFMFSPILSIFMVSLLCFFCSFFIISGFKKLKFGYLIS